MASTVVSTCANTPRTWALIGSALAPRTPGAPGIRVEVVGEAGHDDVEALEPHADQHEERDHVERRRVGARPLSEQDERDEAVAEVLQPEGPRVLPRRPREHRRLLEVLAAVP